VLPVCTTACFASGDHSSNSGSPAKAVAAASSARANRLVQRMSARHLDLLRDLSARNKEKEEQQRKEETRHSKRVTTLRDRILSKNSAGGCTEGESAAPPDENASADERRQWQVRCNKDIESRQREAIDRLQELQRAKMAKVEREQLKRQWRAHKAKGYLLEACKDPELKGFLEVQKPRALPKLPVNAPATISAARYLSLPRRRLNGDSEAADDQVDGDGGHTPRTTASSRPSSVQALNKAEDLEEAEGRDAEEEGEADPTTPSKKQEQSGAVGAGAGAEGGRSLLNSSNKLATQVSQTGGVSKFLSKLKCVQAQQCMRSASDMAEWKRRNGCPPDKQVFICCGGYPDFTEAMLARGWFHNPDKESRFFDMKWSPAADIKHDKLLPEQAVVHFQGNREITTKVGLTLNLRNCASICGADPDSFYPRAFDLYDPLEREDFVLDFKFSKAQAILREFLRTLESGAEMTFSHDVISLSTKICMRLVTDVDDVLDVPELCAGLANVSAREWSILEQVCLDDVTQRLLQCSSKEDLDGFILKKNVLTDAQKIREAEKEKRKKEKEADQGVVVKPQKKKKKAKKDEDEEVEFCAPLTAYEGTRGLHLIKQAKGILLELDQANRQYGTNGCRNAWIVKPSGKSRGRGIKVMRELDEIFRNCETDGFQWICQKYIERPQLIHGYKFDIRQWVLVVDWNPLTVYIWAQPYLRFAGQKYDETLADRSEFVHLVNNSIIKNMDGFNEKNEDLDSCGYMWFRQQYEDYLHKTCCKCKRHRTPFITPPPYTCETFGVRWEDVAFTAKDEDDDDEDEDAGPKPSTQPTPRAADVSDGSSTSAGSSSPRSGSEDGETAQHKEAASATAATKAAAASAKPEAKAPGDFSSIPEHEDDNDESVEECEDLWASCIRPQMEKIIIQSLMSVSDGVQHRKNTAELFGYDFMIGEGLDKPETWLIEVNSSPACDYSTPVTCPLVKKVMEDTAKVLVDLKENPEAPTGEWNLIKHDFGKPVPVRQGGQPMMQLEVQGKRLKAPKGFKKKSKKKKSEKNDSDGEDADDCDDDDYSED